MIETSYLKGREDLLERFLKIPFLKSLGRDHIGRILKLSKLRKYLADETIVSEGGADRWVYVIIHGEVKVVKRDSEIAVLDHPGDIFGELALIDAAPRSASVVALKDTVCLAFDASALEGAKIEDASTLYVIIYRLLTEILANRLRVTSEELVRAREGRDLMEMYMKNEWYQDPH